MNDTGGGPVWRPTLVLSLCAGFCAWLISGAPGIGASAAGLVFAILMWLLLAGFRSQRHPPESYYVLGPVLVVAMLVVMKFGGRRPTAWNDLQLRYRFSGSPAAGAERQPTLYVVRRTSAFTI